MNPSQNLLFTDSYIITAHIDFVQKELFGQSRDNRVHATRIA